MAKWAPQETDTMAAIATEIAHNTGSARAAIAIDGQPGTDLERVADALVAAFAAQGVKAMHARVPGGPGQVPDIGTLRRDLVEPFRTTGTDPGILVVTGAQVLARSVRGLWSWTMWVEREAGLRLADDDPYAAYVRHDDPKAAASAVLDAADPDHPRRNWNDAC